MLNHDHSQYELVPGFPIMKCGAKRESEKNREERGGNALTT